MDRIETRDLDVSYDGVAVLEGMELRIPEGMVTSIIGPNGCGKSTALKTIGRILRPQGGAVYLDGEDIHTLPTREVAKRMAILPQSPQAPEGLTAGELVSYGRFPYQTGFGRVTEEDEAIVRWAMESTGVLEFETSAVDSLSGGQRQRVWIAMALAQQTDLILLDEPTTYLDLAYQLEVLELLHGLNRGQGCTVAMVLHDLNLASRFSDRLIAMRDGRIVASGTPEEVMTPEVLMRTFGIDALVARDPRTGRPSVVSYDISRRGLRESFCRDAVARTP